MAEGNYKYVYLIFVMHYHHMPIQPILHWDGVGCSYHTMNFMLFFLFSGHFAMLLVRNSTHSESAIIIFIITIHNRIWTYCVH